MARLQSLPQPINLMRQRIVVHHQISPQAIEELIDAVRAMRDEKAAGQPVEKEADNLAEKDKLLDEAKLRKQAALGY